MFAKKNAEIQDNDVFFDSQEYQTSNKNVGDILGQSEVKPSTVAANIDVGGANWPDEDEIDIDVDNILNEEAPLDVASKPVH